MTKARRLIAGTAIITAAAGIAAIAIVLLVGNRSTYPQRIFAKQAAEFLTQGYDPVHVLPAEPVEITSGGTWITVTDVFGRMRASSAVDRGMPVNLNSCRQDGVDANCFFVPEGSVPKTLTIITSSGSRQVVAVAEFRGAAEGYVFAGRQTQQTDTRWIEHLRIIVSIWLSGLALFLVANRLLSRR
jgi:hypothetical protein